MRHDTLCKKWLPSGDTIDGRNGQLDSLRALSVTGVLIDHFWPTCILDFVDLGTLASVYFSF
jgi:peptidoglycan/LPS O-acetylase OafA/YrhL